MLEIIVVYPPGTPTPAQAAQRENDIKAIKIAAPGVPIRTVDSNAASVPPNPTIPVYVTVSP